MQIFTPGSSKRKSKRILSNFVPWSWLRERTEATVKLFSKASPLRKKKLQYALGRHRNYNLKTLVETHCPEVRQGAEISSLPGEYVWIFARLTQHHIWASLILRFNQNIRMSPFPNHHHHAECAGKITGIQLWEQLETVSSNMAQRDTQSQRQKQVRESHRKIDAVRVNIAITNSKPTPNLTGLTQTPSKRKAMLISKHKKMNVVINGPIRYICLSTRNYEALKKKKRLGKTKETIKS